LKSKKVEETRRKRGTVMRFRTAIALSCLVSMISLSVGAAMRQAEAKADQASVKIALVNVRRVFRECRRNAVYRRQAMTEYNQTMSELEQLAKELEADEQGLKALKPGSPDHLKQYQQTLEKKAKLDAHREYSKQQRALKDQRWTEQIYQEILLITKELAEQRSLDLVFDKQEPEFPTSSSDELMLTLSTHKLLYSGGCLDITDEVITRLDEEK
jgi:Skp family chaperone for outer membrane proteins